MSESRDANILATIRRNKMLLQAEDKVDWYAEFRLPLPGLPLLGESNGVQPCHAARPLVRGQCLYPSIRPLQADTYRLVAVCSPALCSSPLCGRVSPGMPISIAFTRSRV